MIKVVPRFNGRLGNNLFQIAAAIGYAKQYDVSWGIRKGYIAKAFNAYQVDKYFPCLPECSADFQAYHQYTGKEFCPLHGVQKEFCYFNYHPIPFHEEGVELVGFWQSLKYFQNAEEEVRQAFNIPHVSGYEDCVSIHVRRGDYVIHSDRFPPVDDEYLNSAIEAVCERTAGRLKLLFFSDDIAWCKEYAHRMRLKSSRQPSFIDTGFSEGRNEFEDLSLMASCGHNIIANSSFSWWAAWLNTNPEKFVISPSHKIGNWFGKASRIKADCLDLLPSDWIQIETAGYARGHR